MNDVRKLAFVAHQTTQALNHVARTPNIMAPDGKMSHDKMLSFITQVTKHGLQHFDSGGAVNSGAVNGGQISNDPQPASQSTTIQPGGSTGQYAPVGAQHNPYGSGEAADAVNPAPRGASNFTNPNTAPPNSGVSTGLQQVSAYTPGTQEIGNGFQNATTGAGSVAEGIGSAFTAQNQFVAQGANLQQGTNGDQLNAAYSGVQSGLGQQQGIANALTPGVNQAAGAQYNLSNQLQNQAQGVGPNAAQAQFKQNSQALAGQQAGAIASAKGISPALQARLIAQQGAGAQQNAAGAEATLQAQQQIAAQNNLQNLSANQVAQGATAVQGVNNANQNEQNILQNANTAFNNANVTQQAGLNNVNAATAQSNANAVNKTESGEFSGLSSLAALFAKGGMVEKPKMYADGGNVSGEQTSSPQSYVGQWLSSNTASTGPAPAPADQAPQPPQDKSGGLPGLSSLGGSSGGSSAMAQGGLMKSGGKVAAPNAKEKAVAKGNSYSNDKIPAMLSEDEIVIPREITMSDRAPEKAAMFVAKVLAHKGMVRR